MPAAICPRCQRASPAGSAYCWFDGGSLLSAQDGVQRLAQAFVFPSGKRCLTLEDFAQACQDEWPSARDLLAKDAFRKFFIAMGRHDLVRLAQEAMQHPNTDIQLSRFVDGLPVVRVNSPKLDFQPRRFTLGRLPASDQREIELVLVNQGKGMLQGTVTISEGSDWLSFPESADGRQRVQAAKEQRVRIAINTSKLKSAQSYVGQLMVVTSGGVAEAPVRFELIAKPFAKAPFQGVRTPRELAEKMRTHPKHAGPMLEAGDIERWFAANNWDYPVQGPVAKGVAGVQQFFEAMGLSRPPKLQLSQKELRFTTHYPDTVRFQVAMQTSSRKWVYGQVSSNRPWLKVLTPKIIGPQHANILLEADPTLVSSFPPEECRVQVKGNGGQKLDLSVHLNVENLPRPPEPGFWRPVLIFAMLFLFLRLALIPVVDLHARGAAIADAAARLELTPDASLTAPAGWLQLPWGSLLAGLDAALPQDLFHDQYDGPLAEATLRARDFRHYFLGAFIRDVVFWTWWLGPVLAALALFKDAEPKGRTGFLMRNLPFALMAGCVAGVLLAATLACVFLAVEIVPHVFWEVVFGKTSSIGFLPVWLAVAVFAWLGAGAVVGFIVALVPALRRAIVPVPQALVAGLCRLCRMRGLERLIQPENQ
jgi:hypothetical protein